MTRRMWFLFAVSQLLGEICFWTWQQVESQFGMWQWAVGLVLLFPGNILSALVVERLLWNHGLSLVQLDALEVPLEIVINAALWLLCVKLYILLRAALSRRRGDH